MNAIETHALGLIGENTDTPDVFVEGSADFDQIRDSVNHAIAEICLATGGYEGTYTLPVLVGRTFYRIGNEQAQSVIIVDAWDRTTSRKLEPTHIGSLSENRVDFLHDNGTPLFYYPIGHDGIGFWPTPTAGSIVDLRCIAIPAAYTQGTDVVDIREAWSRAASYYAASEYYASRGAADRAGTFYQDYADIVQMKRRTPKYSDTIQAGHGYPTR